VANKILRSHDEVRIAVIDGLITAALNDGSLARRATFESWQNLGNNPRSTRKTDPRRAASAGLLPCLTALALCNRQGYTGAGSATRTKSAGAAEYRQFYNLT
jgi:hypothetical protein